MDQQSRSGNAMALTPRGAIKAKIEQEEIQKAQFVRELLAKKHLTIEYFPPFQLRDKVTFNQRNAEYGVTIDYNFLINIAKNEYLNSQQIQFYCNLFRKIYATVKVGVAQCHFFSDFMPNSTEKLHDSILDPSFLGKDEKKEAQKSAIQTEGQSTDSQIRTQDYQQIPALQFTHALTETVVNSNYQYGQKNNDQGQKVENVQNNSIPTQQLNKTEKPLQGQKGGTNKTEVKNVPKAAFPEGNNKDNSIQQQSNTNKTQNVKNQPEQQKASSIKYSQPQQQNNTPQKTQPQTQQIQQQAAPQVKQEIKQYEPTQHQSSFQKQQESQQQQPPPQLPLQPAQLPPQPIQQQPQIEKKWNFQITNITVTKVTPSSSKEAFSIEKLDQLLSELAVQNGLENKLKLNQCDYLYFPINQNNYHWVSLIICFKQRIIHYFDSYYSTMSKDLVVSVEALIKSLGHNPQEFKIELHLNKQGNGYDCGIFVLLSLLYTFRDLGYTYDQQVVSEFRRRKLHNLAVIASQVQLDRHLLEAIVDEK